MMEPSPYPADNEIEVSVFSRGYGECIVIHVGAKNWAIIDSLKEHDSRPVALRYLEELGAEPASAVCAILLTHWHDDHVAGSSELVAACPAARIALSGALRSDEFKVFLRTAQIADTSFGSGLDEFAGVLREAKMSGRQVRWCWSERPILVQANPLNCRLEALSPSDQDFERLIKDVATWSSDLDRRLPSPDRNEASVAALLTSAASNSLFGADLERTGPGSGWHAVHQLLRGARPLCDFFKIPHHGSENGHLNEVWTDLLMDEVVTVLTPWNRGRKLPKKSDVDRILARAPNSYAASEIVSQRSKGRLNSVERSLREAGIAVKKMPDVTGHVRFRKLAGQSWRVELVAGTSCHLSKLAA